MSMNFLRDEASGKPVMPPPFELSPVERTHAWWLYLWPFQSRQERVLSLRIFAAVLLLWTLIIWLWFDHGALPYTLAGALIGGVWLGPYRGLPAKMNITTRSEARHHLDDVQKLVRKIGFVPSGQETQPGHYHYVAKAPDHPLLRPLYVEGQTFDLRVGEHTIELASQIRWIEWLHGQLTKQLEA
jgi:hypothetical protein